LEHKKEDNGYSIHISNEELEIAKKVLGYVGVGLVAIRIIRFIVWK